MVRQTERQVASTRKAPVAKKPEKVAAAPPLVGWSVDKSDDDDDDIVSWMQMRAHPDQKRVVWEDSAGSFAYRIHPQGKCHSITNTQLFERESLHERFFRNRQYSKLDAKPGADTRVNHDLNLHPKGCRSAGLVEGEEEEAGAHHGRAHSYLGSRGSEGSTTRVKKLIGLAKKYNTRSSEAHADQEEDFQDDGYGSKISSTEAEGSRECVEGEGEEVTAEVNAAAARKAQHAAQMDSTSRDDDSVAGNTVDDNVIDDNEDDGEYRPGSIEGPGGYPPNSGRASGSVVSEGGVGQAAGVGKGGLGGDRDRVVKFTYSRRSHASQGDGVFPFGRPVASRGRSNPYATLNNSGAHPALAGFQPHHGHTNHLGYTGQPAVMTSLPLVHGYVDRHFRDSADMNNIRYNLDPSKYQVVSCPSPHPDSPRPVTLLLKKVTVQNADGSVHHGAGLLDPDVTSKDVNEGGHSSEGEDEAGNDCGGQTNRPEGEEVDESARDPDLPCKKRLALHSATPWLNVERSPDSRAVSIPSVRAPPSRVPTPRSRESSVPLLHSSQSAPNMRCLESRDTVLESDRSSTTYFPLGELLPAVERSIRRNRKSKLSKSVTNDASQIQTGRRERQPTCYISMDTEENKVLVVPAGLDQPNGPPSFRQQFQRSPLQRAKELSDKRMHGQLVTQPVKRQMTFMDGSQTVTIVSPRVASKSGRPRLASPVRDTKPVSRQRSLSYEMAPSFRRRPSFVRDDVLPRLRF